MVGEVWWKWGSGYAYRSGAFERIGERGRGKEAVA
jgi:hypothetical protein